MVRYILTTNSNAANYSGNIGILSLASKRVRCYLRSPVTTISTARDRKALDGSEYRQCACRSRYSPASAGAGGEYPGPAPLTKQDRSGFLGALDTALQAALREV